MVLAGSIEARRIGEVGQPRRPRGHGARRRRPDGSTVPWTFRTASPNLLGVSVARLRSAGRSGSSRPCLERPWITREDIPDIARVGARMAPQGVSLRQIIAEPRPASQTPALAARLVGAAKWVPTGFGAALPPLDAGVRLVASLSSNPRRTCHLLRSRADGRPAPEPIGHRRDRRRGCRCGAAGIRPARPAYRRHGNFAGWLRLRVGSCRPPIGWMAILG